MVYDSKEICVPDLVEVVLFIGLNISRGSGGISGYDLVGYDSRSNTFIRKQLDTYRSV